MPEEKKIKQPPDESRRKFLKYSGTALGGVVVGGVIGGLIGANTKPAKPAPAPAPGQKPEERPTRDYNRALMFFNQEQFALTEAATERLYPEDELGPGAKGLGVAYYIDHQLASLWGVNARDYMMGPFVAGEQTQGNYPSIRRKDLFTLGLAAMQDLARKKYNKSFTELAGEEQDAVLEQMQNGEGVKINGATSLNFFKLLLSLTLEGVYSDPLYGGNKDMQGWKMRNYPGNQMSYLDIIDKDEFVKIEPASLHDHMSAH